MFLPVFRDPAWELGLSWIYSWEGVVLEPNHLGPRTSLCSMQRNRFSGCKSECGMSSNYPLVIEHSHGPFIDDFPVKTSICEGFSMAYINNQMVKQIPSSNLL